jgi:hypothetical protein
MLDQLGDYDAMVPARKLSGLFWKYPQARTIVFRPNERRQAVQIRRYDQVGDFIDEWDHIVKTGEWLSRG